MATNKKQKINSIWSSFKLRMSLLWIWFIKNIATFIKIAIFVYIVLAACGFIDDKLFLGDISSKIRETIDDASLTTLSGFAASVLSVIFSIYMFISKAKTIALEDIKSKKLKIALIKANLYFDENGDLCKRLETATQIDLNGDGKIAEKDIAEIPTEGMLTGAKRALKELCIILTAKINCVEDGTKVVQAAQLEETSDALGKEINTKEETTTESETTMVEVNCTDEEKVVEVKTKKKTWFSKILSAINDFFAKIFSPITSYIKSLTNTFKMMKADEELTKEAYKEETTQEIKDETKTEDTSITVVTDETNGILSDDEKIIEVNHTEPKVTEKKVEEPAPVVKQPEQEKHQTSAEKRIDDILSSL